MEKEQIIEILLLWNFWGKDINAGIPRGTYLERIKRYLRTDEIIALTGIRRGGKSTILLQVLADLIKNKIPKENTLYINFEDPKFYNILNVDLLDKIWAAYMDYIKPRGTVYLVLDEIQKIEGWEHWVRARYDRKDDIKIFVTGSNAELLSSEFSSVLTGRHLQVAVTPLDFREYLQFNGLEIGAGKLWPVQHKSELQSAVMDFLRSGGFPKVVLTEDELLRKELLSQYFNDILTKDIAERFKVKETGKLKNLALFYSTNFTRKYSYHKIKKVAEFSLSIDSIQRFSHYLRSSFLVDFLPRFSYSLKNQMQTDRKVYFADNGMHNAIAFKFSTDKGKLLENAVYQQLKKQGNDIYYFQGKNEVDFICKDGLKINKIINVCYSLEDKETRLREASALEEGMKYFKLKESYLIVAEGNEEEILVNGCKIHVIPFYRWALT